MSSSTLGLIASGVKTGKRPVRHAIYHTPDGRRLDLPLSPKPQSAIAILLQRNKEGKPPPFQRTPNGKLSEFD